jgi:hypothetical protein
MYQGDPTDAVICDSAGQEERESEDQEAADNEEDSWQQMLWDAISTASPEPKVACWGCLGDTAQLAAFPEVAVEGVGLLGLPLTREQAVSLKAVAVQAPHGRGLRTVVDTAVRDAFQVRKTLWNSSWIDVENRKRKFLQAKAAHMKVFSAVLRPEQNGSRNCLKTVALVGLLPAVLLCHHLLVCSSQDLI